MKKRLLIVAVATATAICGNLFSACGDEFQPEVKSLDYTLSEQSYYTVSGKGNYLSEKELVIPDSVTTICNFAFSGCNYLESLAIPVGVKYIGKNIFTNCYNLQLSYKGTKAQWEAIEKDENWDDSPNGLSVHCTDGDIVR